MKRSDLHYYNEIDPYCCAWLSNLMDAALIPPGVIDSQSILDVTPYDCKDYKQCHFFCGIAGWPLALRIAHWPTTRQVWTGSCPCQPFSVAGKRQGTADERHLWPQFLRLIAQCKPAIVFGEQVASKDGKVWLSGVRSDLENVGYRVGAADLCAAGVGAPHIRQRLYWVADATELRRSRGRVDHGGDTQSARLEAPQRGGIRGAVAARSLDVGLAHHNNTRLEKRQSVPGNSRPQRTPVERDSDAGGLAQPRQVQWERRQSVERPASPTAPQRYEEAVNDQRSSTVGGLADAKHSIRRPQQQINGDSHGRDGLGGGGDLGFWSAYTLIPCLDSASRRIEPRTFPLAHGVPARMGKLRAYGNAIVPQLAAEFIAAYLETEHG